MTQNEYAAAVMNSHEKYREVVNIDGKFYVYQPIDSKYPALHDMYIFLIWDERLKEFSNCMTTIDSFCEGHLDAMKLIRGTVTKSIEMTSSGMRIINHENKN